MKSNLPFFSCMKSLLTLILLTAGIVATPQPSPPVTLPGTQVRTVQSMLNGETYQLLIHFPDNYDAPGLNHLTAIHPTMLQALRWAYCENQPKP